MGRGYRLLGRLGLGERFGVSGWDGLSQLRSLDDRVLQICRCFAWSIN